VIVHVDPDAPVPPFEQLRSQLAALIVAGTLAEGHRLPPIRQLAADLDLAPGTVARAYRELETAGLVRSQGRRGTRVLRPTTATADRERVADLAAAAQRFAAEIAPLELDADQVVDAVRAALVTADAVAR
jgi:GntR family transcriptional regulator